MKRENQSIVEAGVNIALDAIKALAAGAARAVAINRVSDRLIGPIMVQAGGAVRLQSFRHLYRKEL